MKDQAEKLRQLMRGNASNEKKQLIQNDIKKNKAKVLAVTSGKGGVGKSNFAINLAIAIRHLGYSVLIFDADIGMANIEILTGTNIKYTIADLIINDKDVNEIIEQGPEGVKILSGGSGFNQLSVMSNKNINKVIKVLEEIESFVDFIIIDTGAGVSNTVLDFIMAAEEVILITTPDPTSLMDGYTMIKTMTNKGYEGKLNIVVNIVNNRTEAMNIYKNLNKASNSFLKVELNFLGYLEKSNVVNKAVRNQQPFLLYSPLSTVSKKMNVMALNFIESYNNTKTVKIKSFTQKLEDLFFGRGD